MQHNKISPHVEIKFLPATSHSHSRLQASFLGKIKRVSYDHGSNDAILDFATTVLNDNGYNGKIYKIGLKKTDIFFTIGE